MRKREAAKKNQFAHNAVTEPAQPQVQPQAQPQQVLCFVLSPSEAETIFSALGELPAKVSEALRGKIKSQAEQQPTLLRGLYAESSVKELLAAEA